MKKLLSLLLLASICFAVSPANSRYMDPAELDKDVVLKTDCNKIGKQIYAIVKRLDFLNTIVEKPPGLEEELKELKARLIALSRIYNNGNCPELFEGSPRPDRSREKSTEDLPKA